ncbi:MAG: hypothetical protein ABI333_19265 [bacterium]
MCSLALRTFAPAVPLTALALIGCKGKLPPAEQLPDSGPSAARKSAVDAALAARKPDARAKPMSLDEAADKRLICPHYQNRNWGCDPRMNPTIPRLGHEALASVVRASSRGWKRVKFETGPGQGERRCYDWVRGAVRRGSTTVQFEAVDNITKCTCAPGIGRAMLDYARRGHSSPNRRRIRVFGFPGNIDRYFGQHSFALWVADRCTVWVGGKPSVTEKQLVQAAGIIDLKALEVLCKRR